MTGDGGGGGWSLLVPSLACHGRGRHALAFMARPGVRWALEHRCSQGLGFWAARRSWDHSRTQRHMLAKTPPALRVLSELLQGQSQSKTQSVLRLVCELLSSVVCSSPSWEGTIRQDKL